MKNVSHYIYIYIRIDFHFVGKDGGGVTPPAGGVLEVSPGKFWDICIEMVHSECILM